MRAQSWPVSSATMVGMALLAGAGCAMPAPPGPVPIRGEVWREAEPLGHPAEALRRNLAPGDTVHFGALRLQLLEAGPGSTPAARLAIRHDGADAEVRIAAGAAVRRAGHRIAVLAVRGEGELGGGLVEVEVGRLSSVPAHVAESEVAGGADMRLRVPHTITHITLHHTGSREPLRRGDDPIQRLRGLQSWGRTDRNWWDVPYHFLIDLDGRIYEGRDWRYMGETNTTYDPSGHLLISVIGNYGLQTANPAQLTAITALMAWAVDRFDVPVDRIGGHYDHAATTCPGTHLRRRLDDGTFRRGVEAALRARDRRNASGPGRDR